MAEPAKILKYVLPPLILLLAGGGVKAMMAMSPDAARSAPPARIARVEVQELQPVDTPARVRVTGTVEAARQVVVMPEVGGKVVEQSSELVPGGRVAQGDLLLRIDPRDYRLAVEQERSRVRQAELELELETGRQSVAQREWAAVNGDDADAGDAPLAMRLPQMATVQRSLDAARAGLARAELSLERSALRAPFNAIITSEDSEIGQVLGAGSRVATLVGTDRVHVRAAVPVEHLPFLDIPGMGGTASSPATVIHDLGAGGRVERAAQVLRLVGTLDPQTRTAQLMLAVDQPLDLPAGAPPLLPGAYVDIVIEGRLLTGALPIPRHAVFDGNRAWTVDTEERLASRDIVIAWRDGDRIFAGGGLEAGDRVVTSPMALPIEGMKIEIVGAAGVETGGTQR